MGDSEGVYNGRCVFLGMRNTMAFTIGLKLRRQGNKVTLPCLSPSRLRFWSLSYHEKKKIESTRKRRKDKKKSHQYWQTFLGEWGELIFLKLNLKASTASLMSVMTVTAQLRFLKLILTTQIIYLFKEFPESLFCT